MFANPFRHLIGSRRRRRIRPHDETEYLLASPANARRLLRALADAKAGKGMKVESIDEFARTVGL